MTKQELKELWEIYGNFDQIRQDVRKIKEDAEVALGFIDRDVKKLSNLIYSVEMERRKNDGKGE